ncbi:MAG TPA: hypothetical protein VFL91_29670 [Thermomicrobiales bacterium]|nr:hypothetical protein [Thermomicrobiales bacterium]
MGRMDRYLVFARRQYDEPLAHQGDVEVAAGEDPAGPALARFGDDWLELVLIPEAAIERVPLEAEAEARP